MLTVERLREQLLYTPERGEWFWRKAIRGRAAGTPAGCYTGGRHLIRIDGRLYKGYRLAFLYMLGRWPHVFADHRDGNPLNGQWNNLRDATRRQSAQNMGRRSHNKSGFKGVFWNKQANRWQARITYGGKQRYLGQFDTAEEAYAKYCEVAARAFGEFFRR